MRGGGQGLRLGRMDGRMENRTGYCIRPCTMCPPLSREGIGEFDGIFSHGRGVKARVCVWGGRWGGGGSSVLGADNIHFLGYYKVLGKRSVQKKNLIEK